MTDKNQQFLAYIISKHEKATVTVLMKICYLTDLVNIEKNNKQLFSYEYKRYHYGPFDEKIYNDLSNLQIKNTVITKSDYTADGKEYIYYSFNEQTELDNILKDELEIINEVLESIKGFGAKVLTQIAYKTKPMIALGATLGGKEKLNKKLNLKAK